MSKFRNNTKTKIDVSGKTPTVMLYQPICRLTASLGYEAKHKLYAVDKRYKDFVEGMDTFSRDAMYTKNDDVQSKQYFLAVTKNANKEYTFVDTATRYGIVVSIGLLRDYIKDVLPIALQYRYAVNYRGDRRKKESKSKDWVKPDFKQMNQYQRVLDVIQYVKDSICDVVECSGNARLFGKLSQQHSSYRYRQIAQRIYTLSQRYEVTNWFNTARKCYYDSYAEDAWRRNEPRVIRADGMDYDTILSEVVMSME